MKLYKSAFNLVGHVFGQLVVESLARGSRRGNFWRCACSCGNKNYEATAGDLRSGRIKSCGCFKTTEAYRAINITHGQRRLRTRAYGSWAEMKRRCSDPTRDNYKYYGAKGIKYDPAWETFEAFYADMGDCPIDFELDRIDAKLGYSKANCRWLAKLDNIKSRDGVL